MSDPANLHIEWAQRFIEAAANAGVRHVVLSPGSRSTPLAIAAHRSASVELHVIVDERSAGFFALGQGRVTGKPSLLVCTSGTAGAHYFAAVIEASHARIPMIIATADRPWELAHAAAPQTIDQLKLFGDFVRLFADIGQPDPSPLAVGAVARFAAQAADRATAPVPGPVHLNLRFRKPLDPAPSMTSTPDLHRADGRLFRGRRAPARAAPETTALTEIAERCRAAERGLLVCGPAPASGDVPAYRAAIFDLARATGFTLCAEATSQARFDPPSDVSAISCFDALLRSERARRALAPDLILEVGSPPTSGGYERLVAERPDVPRYVLTPSGDADPAQTAALIVQGDVVESCQRVARALGVRAPPQPNEHGLAWLTRDREAQASAADLAPAAAPSLTERDVASAILTSCPENAWLVVGNSNAVREIDNAPLAAAKRAIRVVSQRGASGIDGLVSGAAGASFALGDPVLLWLGDLSFAHDLTGLAVARRARAPLVIVVVQNGGGRIFEQLPIHGALRDDPEAFRQLFATPLEIDLAAAASAFGVRFVRAEAPGALRAAITEGCATKGATLIEAIVPPHEAATRVRAWWRSLEEIP